MPDIIIIFGNTTVEKTVSVTTLKIYDVSVCVCWGWKKTSATQKAVCIVPLLQRGTLCYLNTS